MRAIEPEKGQSDMFVFSPEHSTAWVRIGDITLEIAVSDEGSVGVTASTIDCDGDEPVALADFYVSWQELDHYRCTEDTNESR
jgi:hypothetical protein